MTFDWAFEIVPPIAITSDHLKAVFSAWCCSVWLSRIPICVGQNLSVFDPYLKIWYRRTRQIIRYRATATLQWPQSKQYTTSNEGVAIKPTKLLETFRKCIHLTRFTKFLLQLQVKKFCREAQQHRRKRVWYLVLFIDSFIINLPVFLHRVTLVLSVSYG